MDKHITVTKKETEFLTQLADSEYVEWGFCVGDWVCSPDYDMKITRGLITSLSKKGIIKIGGNRKGFQGQDMIWISINEEYLDTENERFLAGTPPVKNLLREVK